MTRVAALTAVMCVSSMIYIPLTVPITLQSLALFFGLFSLGGRDTAVAATLYVLLGIVGLPVFSGFRGGFARLLDPTGGFILALPISAFIFWLLELAFRPQAEGRILLASISLIVIYSAGSIWFSLVYLGLAERSFITALLTCVLPFVLPDIIKLSLAYFISKKLPRLS